MADIGYIALFLALIASSYSVIAFIVGVKRKHPEFIKSGRNSLIAVCVLVTVSVAALMFEIFSHDFQLSYVASYTSRDLSAAYLLGALWAGNAGSMLFWVWLLAIGGVVVLLQKRDMGRELVPYAAMIIAITQTFFLILLLSPANPFAKLSSVPPDGMGLNPLLENPGMFFHPPTLLGGYVGFTFPFAFGMAALLSGRTGDEWIVMARRWALLAWLSLGIGNLIGAWWAYVELGWGGYWAWDPVENAGLLPWLVGTAFLHSIMMQRRRGILKIWNMVLVILTFVLSILGTFLTRSGVLASVHTFSDTGMGPPFTVFMGIALFASLALLYHRSEDLKSEAQMESVVSRESTFLLNNLLLVGAAFAVFVGTIFPLISEAVRHVKITVGAPFFNEVNSPIFLAIVLLSGICALIGWRQASIKNLVRNFLWPLAIAVAMGIILFFLGIREWYALLAFPLCAFVSFTILYEWFRGTRARHRMKGESYLKSFFGLITANKPRYGGYIVHLGIILITLGIVASSLYDVQKEATLMPGDSMTIKNYTLTYQNLDRVETQSKLVVTATMSLSSSQKPMGKLVPEKYFHRNYEQAVTEVAIRTTLKEDLYVILVGWDQSGATAFKVLVNPMVQWVWIGGWLLMLGGLVAFWPDRRKLAPMQARNREEVGDGTEN